MDFTLVEKIEKYEICYKLLRSNFYRNYYVIIAQDKKDFYCGSVFGKREEVSELFREISESGTEIYCVADILNDFHTQKV